MKQSFNLSVVTSVFLHQHKYASDNVSPGSDGILRLAIHPSLPAGTGPSFL